MDNSQLPIDNYQLSTHYKTWLSELKTRIHQAQQRASQSVNRELVLLYWHIGRDICERQEEQGWGAKVIDRLSRDLRSSFPEMKGFSSRNLKYMRAFANSWADPEFVQEVLAQLPWYHQITLPTIVIPAQAGIYTLGHALIKLDSRLRGNDES